MRHNASSQRCTAQLLSPDNPDVVMNHALLGYANMLYVLNGINGYSKSTTVSSWTVSAGSWKFKQQRRVQGGIWPKM